MEGRGFRILLQLLPYGKFAQDNKYNTLSERFLRFDITLKKETHPRFDTLKSEEMYVFSMCGSSRKDCSGDQGIEELVKRFRCRVPRSKRADFDRLIEIWRKYHLNDMTPGTKAQEDAINEWVERGGGKSKDYVATCNYLESIGLLEDRGYRYGSGWLCRPIDEDDIKFIEKICSEWE